MTDNDIIKALECCKAKNGLNNQCDKCPFHSLYCMDKLIVATLDLINRQKAEIERLEGLVTDSFTDKIMIPMMIETAKAEAVKEFAERLKEKYPWNGDYLYSTRRTVENIDNLVKEMVGEE